MKKIKIIQEHGIGDFESKINKFCKNKELHDIQYQTHKDEHDSILYTAFIIYEVK
jgi:hypothetical protein